jgi:5-methylcytosine-specific restriction endonuclease McrA
VNQRCLVENCEYLGHHARGYCKIHYTTLLKKKIIKKLEKPINCSVLECNQKYYSNGYCIMHYGRWKKNLPMDLPFGSKDEYLRGNLDFEHKSRDMWSISIRRYYGDKCQVCGWNEDSCDVHHIVAKSKSGKNTLDNAVVLCPNCHRLANRGRISEEKLKEYKTLWE